ncbi:hypothetical protein [Sandarakinorhabdus rubra]|uniref:hypothetical protein n=1 Tax=Sandarakinorhabdus rubra TaxID=2672568 RepID=UPI0013DCD44C|nr:hypothetical protein [Sandarakinorhabdus rubra]
MLSESNARHGRFWPQEDKLMNIFNRILILGAASLALAACSQATKEETSEAANSAAADTAANTEKAGDAIETAGDKAGAAIDEAGDKAAVAASDAKQNTGEALEEAGKDMQKPN